MGTARNLFYYLSGLGTLPENAQFELSLEDGFLIMNYLKIKVLGRNEVVQQYKINACDIVALDIVNTADLKKKSMLARGAAGGILFGPVGAVLGGMSAAAQSKIKSTLSIGYISSGNGEMKSVVFNADPPSWGGLNRSAIAKFKKILEKVPKSAAVLEYLGQTQNADGSITL